MARAKSANLARLPNGVTIVRIARLSSRRHSNCRRYLRPVVRRRTEC